MEVSTTTTTKTTTIANQNCNEEKNSLIKENEQGIIFLVLKMSAAHVKRNAQSKIMIMTSNIILLSTLKWARIFFKHTN